MNPVSRLLTLCAVLAVLVGCSKPAPAPEPVRAVRTLTVSTGWSGGVHEYAGETRARVDANVGFRVGGKLIRRWVEVGQHVNAGQPLAQLDTADLRLTVETAAAATRSAQTQYELAAAEFKRYKELRDKGFIGALELDRRQTALLTQQAQLEQAKAQAQVQNNQADYGVLRAPMAGVVTAVEAETGTVLATGAPVFRLAGDGPRDAVFSVPEDKLVEVRPLLGKAGAVQVKPWGAAAAVSATVREVAAVADPATRTFQIKASLGHAAVQLGQTVTVVVEFARREGIIKLPLAAVMQQNGQTAVWLVDRETMTVQVLPIVVAGADGNDVVVAAGLTPGQIVVTAGVHALAPGQKVKFYEPQALAVTTPVPPARSH